MGKQLHTKWAGSFRVWLLVLASVVFVSELLVMFVMYWLRLDSRWMEALLDSSLLTLLISPPLYLLGFRPLLREIAERKRTDAEREALSNIIQGVVTTSNLDELFELIHRSIGQILYAENCYVALYDAKTDLLSVPFCIDKYDTPAAPAKLGTGLTAYVLRKNQPMLMTTDAIHELAEKGDVAVIGTDSAIWLGVPLRTPEGVIGVLVVQHYEDATAYDQGDLRFLTSVGEQIATAIERKRVEAALRISEEQHRLMFESNPHPVFVVDLETLAFLAVNEAAIELYGYSRDEFTTSITAMDLRPPENASDFSDRLSRARNGQDIILESSRHSRKDGTVIDIEITQHELTFAGRRAGIVRINDVTERRRLEAESTVISEIIQGVTSTVNLEELLQLIHRSIGRILYAENCFVALVDPKTELLYTQFFVDKVDAVPLPSKLGSGLTAYVFRNGQPMLMNAEVIRELTESGDIKVVGTIPAIWLGVPLRTPAGIIGVLVVQHYEDEEAYSLRDLNLLVAVGDQIALAIERKRVEDQLRIFNDKLQQSNRELQDFAYVASHDLQEPLRKVQAFSDRLRTKYSDKLEGDGLDYLERMRSAANRMQLLIQDLLTFSRVSTQAQPFTSVNLKTIADEVLSDLEVKIEETGATVELKDLPMIDADAIQMRQLLQNLVGNALKFRQMGNAPVISISSQTLSANGNGIGKCCQIVVKDNGIGFDEKYTDKIFAVFQRLHGRAEYEGSGVGLAICRKIVERHNGTITAQSAPGEGASFSFILPLKQNDPEVIQ